MGAEVEAGVGAPEAPAGVEETESGDVVSMVISVDKAMIVPLKEGILVSILW